MIDQVIFICNWKLSFVPGKSLKCDIFLAVDITGVNFVI